MQVQVFTQAHAVAGRRTCMAELALGVFVPGFSMTFSRNEEVFGEEEAAEFVYKVLSGVVRTTRLLADGRRQIVAFHMPGDVFGLEVGQTHRFSAEAIGPCELALVRRTVLDMTTQNDPAAWRAVWTLTALDLERMQDHMVLLGRKTAAEKVEAFLADMSARAPASDGVELPMSRTDIADYLGLTIETVSRILSQMEREHRIARATSRHVVLCDRRLLQAAA